MTRARLREVDLLARYGGEELIALLPETSPADALQRLRAGARGHRGACSWSTRALDGNEREVRCTASLGVATMPSATLQTAEDLLRAADECLYAAKGAGRNRVRQHEE